MQRLLLDLVGAAEHVVNIGKVVGSRVKTVSLALGGITLLQVGLLAEVAHLERVSHVLGEQ